MNYCMYNDRFIIMVNDYDNRRNLLGIGIDHVMIISKLNAFYYFKDHLLNE
jgi:hypothetical protein